MDLKRAINRLETVARRPSWRGTEQARAIAVVIEAAKKQLPPAPQPKDHLVLWCHDGEWKIVKFQMLLTKEEAFAYFSRFTRQDYTLVVVKVPV